MNNLGIAREILRVLKYYSPTVTHGNLFNTFASVNSNLGVYKLECEMCFIKALLPQNVLYMSMSTPDLNWKNNVYLQHYISMETSETKMNAVASNLDQLANRSAGLADKWFGMGSKIFQDTRIFHGFTHFLILFFPDLIQHGYHDTWFFPETKNRAI